MVRTKILEKLNYYQKVFRQSEKEVIMVKEYINPSGLRMPKGFLSQAIKAGNTIYISGQSAFDKDGKIVGEGDVIAQGTMIFEKIKLIVEAAGASMSDIVELHQFFKTREDYVSFSTSDVRQKFFGDHRPTSRGLVVTDFRHPGMLMEVSAVAVVD